MRARLIRPLAGGAALAVVVPIALALAPASAVTATRGGDSTSGAASVISLSVDNHTVKALSAALSTTTLTPQSLAAIRVVPVTVLDTAAPTTQEVGAVSYNQDTTSQPNIAPQNGGVVGLVSVTSPTIVAKATRTAQGPLSVIAASSIGSLGIRQLSLGELQGSLKFTSSVRHGVASAAKSVSLSGLSLPSLSQLLQNLGVDFSKVPIAALQTLLHALSLTSGLATYENAFTAALNAAKAKAPAGIDLSTYSAIASANSAQLGNVNTAAGALTTAIGAANFTTPAVTAVLSLFSIVAPVNAADWTAFTPVQRNALLAVLPANKANAISSAATTLFNANALLGLLPTLLSAASGLLESLLINLSTGSILTLKSVSVHTLAEAGGRHSAKISGQLDGLSVLGTNILQTVLHTSTPVDVANLLTAGIAQVQSKINTLTDAVGAFLSTITGVTVKAPSIQVLKKSTSLSPEGAFQAARADVTALSFFWPGMSLPTSIVGNEVVIGKAAVSPRLVAFATPSFGVQVATLSEHTRYTAAAVPVVTPVTPTVTPPAQTPDLAKTGLPVGVSVVAALLLMAAYAVRRFRRTEILTTD
jgi:hypothetical protein